MIKKENGLEYPLYGIIYNWKGLKEENYLYTAKEMMEYDKDAYEAIKKFPNESVDGAFSANKTYVVLPLYNSNELMDFLKGGYNDEEAPFKDDQWYWECVLDNDLFGKYSYTMEKAVKALGIPKNKLTMENAQETISYCNKKGFKR